MQETADAPIFGPKFSIPDQFLEDFTMRGQLPVLVQFRYETSGGNLSWTQAYWDSLQPKIEELMATGKHIGYSSDAFLLSALQAFPVGAKVWW